MEHIKMDCLENDNNLWWYEAKNKTIDYILHNIKKEYPKILSVGCGTAEEVITLEKYGEVTCIDKNSDDPEVIREDITNNTQADEEYDLVVCLDVLEHIKDDQKAISEMARITKTGGILILSVPMHPKLYGAHDRALKHYRRYTTHRLRRLLEKVYYIEFMSYWNVMLFPVLAVKKLLQKKGNKVDSPRLPYYLQLILYRILVFEGWLISKGWEHDIGMSMIILGTKR